jgi:TPR repeat protein
MANREELAVIRGARSGDAACQLRLGKLYLTGGASLPCSLPTALHWLSRAAATGLDEAWLLIGRHIPWQYASDDRDSLLPWYARASEAGVVQAAFTLGQLLLQEPAFAHAGMRQQARRALDAAAGAGSAEARALLARLRPAAPEPVARGTAPVLREMAHDDPDEPCEDLLRRGRALLAQAPAEAVAWRGSSADARLLSRCARAMAHDHGDAAVDGAAGVNGELQRMRELAAAGGDRDAQLALGLQLARMDAEGARLAHGGMANFKRAVRWLTLAGEQGLAGAWFALSRIYVKPEFSQRCVSEAQACLERAAELGHVAAQLDCGMHAWRLRRSDERNDIKAVWWLQKAAAQGCGQARAMLERIAPPLAQDDWAAKLLPLVTRELEGSQPLLAARIELAHRFRLTRAEALLLDVKAADHGHCLVVDIRASYGRARRRIVMVEHAHQRRALDRIARVFERCDRGMEGNYRQRLYRFKTWLQPAGVAGTLLAA